MIREWVEDLLTLTDEDWGRYSFSRDPLVGRIGEEEQAKYRQKAEDCALEMVRHLHSKYEVIPIEQFTKLLGIKLLYKKSDINSVYTMFACFEEPDTITIFRDNAEATDKLLMEQELYELVGNVKTADLLIAHELYHYFEHTIPNVYTAQKNITLWKLGSIENRSCIVCLEEIGAMAFARELTGLKCSPYIFDVIMLYVQNPPRAKKLYESFMSFKAM